MVKIFIFSNVIKVQPLLVVVLKGFEEEEADLVDILVATELESLRESCTSLHPGGMVREMRGGGG